jgi:6-phosphogluconolactonase (cycloisomerase 2 family)
MKKSIQVLLSAVMLVVSVLSVASANAYYIPRIATLSNAAEGNELLVFAHVPGKGIIKVDSVATGGFGTGAPLISNQDGLIVSEDGDFMYAVNTGSNEISVFEIGEKSVKLIQTIDSQGVEPISLTQYGDLVYVVNQGTDNIAGYKVRRNGKLRVLRNSTAPLSGVGTAPAQISFTPDGKFLVVTEKLTDLIVTYPVLRNGRPGDMVATESALPVPFGFDFDRFGHLVVSEATIGGGPDIGIGAGVSSYEINYDGSLTVLTGGVVNSGRAACWVVFNNGGRVAYVTNTVSNTVSVYRTNRRGDLTLVNDIAATTDDVFPTDIALSASGRILYTLTNGAGSIDAFFVKGRTNLKEIADTEEVPASSNGLVTF